MDKRDNSVLIVDDEAMNIKALTHILKPFYTVYVAKDGQAALNSAQKLKPDVILLDVVMPGINGFQVITALKENDETKNIPVIFVTGKTQKEDEGHGLALGAADYITKPFDATIVRLRVRNQVQIVNQVKMIEHLSMTDSLTELANRRHFNIRLEQEWSRAKRDSLSTSLLIMDIDDFKKINDKYGHLFGDKVLKNVADNIKYSLKRSMDLLSRWGGEEFAVLLPNTTIKGAYYVAEDIRKTVERRDYPLNELDALDEKLVITISIGINSLLPDMNSSLTDFIDIADKALYLAKEIGKNRICSMEDLKKLY